jgi:anti-anti-sigma factor
MVRSVAVEVEPTGLDSPPVPPTPDYFSDDVERRIEDWLVCYLDDKDPDHRTANVNEMLEAGTMVLPQGQKRRRTESKRRRNLLTRHWARIEARRIRSAVVVKLLDQLLIKENVIEELADELDDVVRTGDRRIVISFSHVERMSSHIVALIAKLDHCCGSEPGGQLRVCGLHPDVAGVFALTGVGATLDIYPDEAAAVTAPWPARKGPRPLPVSILSQITGSLHREEPPEEPNPWSDSDEAWPDILDDPDAEPDRSFVWLLVEAGPAYGPTKGCVIPVGHDRFLIGSSHECNLCIPGTRFAPQHAAINRRGSLLQLAMLGSGVPTKVNGRLLGRASVPLRSGDRVHLGPLVFTVIAGDSHADLSRLEDVIISWLHEETEAQHEPVDETVGIGTGSSDEIPIVEEEVIEEESFAGSGLRYRVIQDVMVVTPKTNELDDNAAVEQLRTGLAELSEMNLPVKVVIDLSHVSHITSRWLGMMLAYYLRLSRAGGSLRLCELHSRVLSVLEQFRLPILIEVFAKVEEAVIQAWD